MVSKLLTNFLSIHLRKDDGKITDDLISLQNEYIIFYVKIWLRKKYLLDWCWAYGPNANQFPILKRVIGHPKIYPPDFFVGFSPLVNYGFIIRLPKQKWKQSTLLSERAPKKAYRLWSRSVLTICKKVIR